VTTHLVEPAPGGTRSPRKGDGVAKGLIFLAAFLSFVLSVGLWFGGDKERGLYVGIWVPSILSAGALLLTGRRND